MTLRELHTRHFAGEKLLLPGGFTELHGNALAHKTARFLQRYNAGRAHFIVAEAQPEVMMCVETLFEREG